MDAIDLGWKLLSIARSLGCLDDMAMERLDDMRASLETHRRGGLTEKNMTLVRQVISGDVWRRVINLPEALMEQARLWRDQSAVKAAVTAQLAVAIAILTNAGGKSVPFRVNQVPNSTRWQIFVRDPDNVDIELNFETINEVAA
jgi:hypothetical protein